MCRDVTVLVMKQFDAGLFTGTVKTAIKKRGRFLYHVEYEDGDCEDYNDKEFGEAYDLYILSLTSKKPNEEIIGDSDNCSANSGGETEGSEYDAKSDEDEKRKAKKKRRTSLITQKPKEKGTMKGGNKSLKEEDGNIKTKTNRGKHKRAVIDVEALYKSGNKNSVMNKTIDAMTAAQKEDVMESAEKKIVSIAKKGLRVEAMKVGAYISRQHSF
jgi:hypothetical protein